MKKLIISLVLIAMSFIYSYAQSQDFYVGYTFTRHNLKQVTTSTNDESDTNGFVVNYTVNPFKSNVPVGSTVEVAGSFSDRSSLYTVLTGVTFKNKASKDKFVPFAKILAGVGRQEYKVNSNFSLRKTLAVYSFGGGLDTKLNDKLQFRVGGDYLLMKKTYNGSNSNAWRFQAGLVF